MMIFFPFEFFQEKNARRVYMQLYMLENRIEFNGLTNIKHHQVFDSAAFK